MGERINCKQLIAQINALLETVMWRRSSGSNGSYQRAWIQTGTVEGAAFKQGAEVQAEVSKEKQSRWWHQHI